MSWTRSVEMTDLAAATLRSHRLRATGTGQSRTLSTPNKEQAMAQANLKNQQTIIANQKRILRNQERLAVLLGNQGKILRNQQAILKNQKKILVNQVRILAK
jgi:hypothetical protein